MKIKKLFEMKNECDKNIRSLRLALDINGGPLNNTAKIYLKPEQAEEIMELLKGYQELLDNIIDNVEVNV